MSAIFLFNGIRKTFEGRFVMNLDLMRIISNKKYRLINKWFG